MLEIPEPIREILGNPRYKFAILIVLSLLAVFFIYSGDSPESTTVLSSIQSYLPELMTATTSAVAVAATTQETPQAASVVESNIELLAPF